MYGVENLVLPKLSSKYAELVPTGLRKSRRLRHKVVMYDSLISFERLQAQLEAQIVQALRIDTIYIELHRFSDHKNTSR